MFFFRLMELNCEGRCKVRDSQFISVCLASLVENLPIELYDFMIFVILCLLYNCCYDVRLDHYFCDFGLYK